MIYRCEAVFDPPAGAPLVVLKGGGDVIRLECPSHEFGPFEPDCHYRILIEKVEISKTCVDTQG